jgi:predicted permease
MSRLRALWARLRASRSHDALDREFDAERRVHLEMAARDLEQRGLDPVAARRQARVDFGSADAALELQREARSLHPFTGAGRDLGYAIRSLRRDPGMVAVAVVILAIGIAANTAVFSLVRPVLLKPLPFADAGSLVWVSNIGTNGLSGATFQVATFEALRDRSQSIVDWTAYFAFFGYGNNTITGAGDPERVVVVDVAPRFFEALGVQPAYGRFFHANEFVPKGPAVVVVSHEYWTRRLNADPGVVGTYVHLNERPTLIAGVAPPTFDFASVFTPGTRVDLFTPAIFEDMRPWGNTLALIGRLRGGTSIDAARRELDALVPVIRADLPNLFRFGTRVTALQDHVSGSMRRPLYVLWGAVGLVLLIVCANVSNLLLARGTTRAKEFAVRVALGASRARIFQQLALEGIVLAGLGAALGIPLAYALTALLRQHSTLAIPLLTAANVDVFALLVTAIVALATGLLFSLLPALRVASIQPQAALTDQARGTTAGRRHGWTRSALVIVEIAMACVLIVSAGLLVRSFITLLDTDYGFRPAETTVLTLKASRDRTPEQMSALLTGAVRAVSRMPGVEAAGVTDALPLDRNRAWSLSVPGVVYPNNQRPVAFAYVVGPGYVRAMGMRMVHGRDFAETDTADMPRVVVVSESLARALYAGQNPIGRPVQILQGAPHAIAGVVADVRQNRLDETSAAQFYLPYLQGSGLPMDLVVRATVPPERFVNAVRRELLAIDQTFIVTDVRPLHDLIDRAVSPRRFLVTVLSAFSLFAVALACLGIYGVVAYGVTQRIQEFGVRMALGATAGDMRRTVLGGTLRLAAMGIAIGLLASLLLSRVIGSLLFGTSPFDVPTFAWTAGILLIVALLAGLLPAMQASRIAPLRALSR